MTKMGDIFWAVVAVSMVAVVALPSAAHADIVRIPDTSCEGKSEGDKCTVNSFEVFYQGDGVCVPDDTNSGRDLRCLTEREQGAREEVREREEQWVMHREKPKQGCGTSSAVTAGSVVIGLILLGIGRRDEF